MSAARGRSDGVRFDPIPILELLVRHDVRFVLIGGVAGNAHGSTTVTLDTDICYQRDERNLEKLAAALRELRVTLRGADPSLPFKIDARTIRNGLNFTFETAEYGAFDCLGEASGYTYEIIAANCERGDIGGVIVPIASLDDLIRMKRAAGRLKDLVEIENLSKLRDVREERGLYGLAEPQVTPRSRTRASRKRKTSPARR